MADTPSAGGFRTKGRSLSIAITFALLAAFVVLVRVVPGGDIVALSSLMIGTLVAYLRLRTQRNGSDVFEIILPVSFLYFVYFCASSLYIRFSNEHLIDLALRPYLVPALALAAAGYLAMLAGYALVGARTRPPAFAGLTIVHPVVPLFTGWVGAIGLSAGKWQERSMSTGAGISPAFSLIQQFGAFYFFGWFLAWYEFWAGRLRGLAAILVLGSLAFATGCVAFLTLGNKSLLIANLALPGVAYYEVKRRIPVRALVAVCLVGVFVIFPLFNTYRTESRFLSEQDRIEGTIATARTWSADDYLQASVFAFFKRMTAVTSVAAVVADTGTVVPYKNGETLLLAPIGLLIPRFIWPEKPSINVGGEFGRAFKLVNALDTDTMIATTFVGDLYWNFGIPAVIIGMLLVGGGYRWYYESFGSGQGYEPVRKSLYGMMLLNALQIEGSVAITVAGFVKMIVLGLVFVLLARHFRLVREAGA